MTDKQKAAQWIMEKLDGPCEFRVFYNDTEIALFYSLEQAMEHLKTVAMEKGSKLEIRVSERVNPFKAQK